MVWGHENTITMEKFNYIVEKILKCEFNNYPFKHLYIEDFLSDSHFNLLRKDSQIILPPQKDTRTLIQTLKNIGYNEISFPGCIIDLEKYIRSYESNSFSVDKNRLETFGVAFKLKKILNQEIQELVDFLNGPVFHKCLQEKFLIGKKTKIATAIQKYLSGYEISPHPDRRSKCLTYLININTHDITEDMDIHTHLLTFKPEYEYVQSYWKENQDRDTDWVPWEWCETKKLISKNNSLIMFAPSDNTLHAIKLKYDHCVLQRTQLYGNLWFTNTPKIIKTTYLELMEKRI